MQERYKVLLGMVLMSLGLWFGIVHFMGSTADFAEGLDTRSTAYLEKQPADPEMQEKAAAPAQPTVKPASDNQEGAIITVESVTADGAREDSDAAENADADGEESSPDEEKADNEGRADSDEDMRDQKAEESAVPAEDKIAKKIVLVKTGQSLQERELLEQLDKDLVKGPAPTRAMDIRLTMEKRGCRMSADERTRTGVLFRHGSAAIKGASLNRLDGLIALYQRCGGTLQLEHNPQGQTDANVLLKQRRQDEVKYYLLQRRIPKASIEFPESS